MNYPLRSLQRKLFYYSNKVFDNLYINEFPKSGGTWVCRVLHNLSNYRFDDDKFQIYGNAITKFHDPFLNASRQLIVFRDPRDVFLSYFRHCSTVYEDFPFNQKSVFYYNNLYKTSRAVSTAAQQQLFLDEFIIKPMFVRCNWSDFYNHLHSRLCYKNTLWVSYESLRHNTFDEFSKIVDFFGLTVSASSLKFILDEEENKRINSSKKPFKNNFIGKGQVNNWKENLSPKIASTIEAKFGNTMKTLGY